MGDSKDEVYCSSSEEDIRIHNALGWSSESEEYRIVYGIVLLNFSFVIMVEVLNKQTLKTMPTLFHKKSTIIIVIIGKLLGYNSAAQKRLSAKGSQTTLSCTQVKLPSDFRAGCPVAILFAPTK